MGIIDKKDTPIEKVARLIRSFNRAEKVRLLQLVPELQTIPASEESLPAEQMALMTYFEPQLTQFPPLEKDAEFIGGLTIEAFFALPEDIQDRLWQREHDRESAKQELVEVEANVDALPAG